MRHLTTFGMPMFIIAISIVLGCTSPLLRTEASTSGIRAAEEVGAAGVPQASLHLLLAKEELEKAIEFSKNDERKKAESMLLRSEVDAELAVALSREDTEKIEGRAAVARVRQLRQDNSPTPVNPL
ncbi:MAG: hypothetical protein A2284_03040 [Deltaproteobacteria bacterium RIFOXYA12_FULL_61_11]|nr:MAG: hypothetical protein A2284_03040 [Deltaproteobacteria bacterium RIFOXYA12_FULL_61_11]